MHLITKKLVDVAVVIVLRLVAIAPFYAIFNTILIMPFIRHTFDSVDATVNRNSDRENGTIYPVTPTKELNGDFSSTKHHVSGHTECTFCHLIFTPDWNVDENVFRFSLPFVI